MKAVIGVLSMMVAVVASHRFSLGRCRRANTMEGFEMEKFLGRWLVVGNLASTSSCLAFTFSRNSDGEYEVKESKELALPELVGVDYKYSVVGTLKPKDESSGKFDATFPTNPLGSANYQILGTDYDNYATIYHCQNILGFARRMDVFALTRNLSDSEIAFDKSKTRMSKADADLPVDDLERVSQEGCVTAEEADIHTHFDGDLFDLSPEDIAAAVDVATKVKDVVEEFN